MELSTCKKWQNDSSATALLHSEEKIFKMIDEENEHLSVLTALKRANMSQNRRCRTMASEQSLSSTFPRKLKATWAPTIHIAFVDVCLEETLKGNKPGTHFTKEGWKNIIESFHKKTGLRYNRLQLKNHWDNTKEQWKVWCKLIGTTSMKWDPSTNEFGAAEEDWDNYLGENSEAAQFRNTELQCADKLQIIFDGTTIIGETEPPTQRRKCNHDSTAAMMHMKQSGTAKPVGMIQHLAIPLESRTPVIHNQKSTGNVPSSIQSKFSFYSIGECIDCLDAMDEVEQGSELYLFALDVFLKKEYREIFLHIKQASVRISWLQRLQSVGQPLQ